MRSTWRLLGNKLYWMCICYGFTNGLWPSVAALHREDRWRRLELDERQMINRAHVVLEGKK